MQPVERIDLQALDCAELLSRISVELETLHWLAIELQESFGKLDSSLLDDEQSIRSLQRIDAITQYLLDLSNATRVVGSEVQVGSVSVKELADKLILNDLINRLVLGEDSNSIDSGELGDVALF